MGAKATEAYRIKQRHADRLVACQIAIETAERELCEAIAEARQARITWTLIGKCVGMSKQGARQKWGL